LYGERLADVEPDDIGELEDLSRLPFTRKDDLRNTYPLGMLATPRDDLARAMPPRTRPGSPRWSHTRRRSRSLRPSECPHARHGRRRPGDDAPQRLRLRAVHGRPRAPRRRRVPRSDCRSRLRRDDRAAAHVDRGPAARRDLVYAELLPHARTCLLRARCLPGTRSASGSLSSGPSPGRRTAARDRRGPRRSLHESLTRARSALFSPRAIPPTSASLSDGSACSTRSKVLAEPRRDVYVSLTDERVRELSERTAALIRDTIGCTMAVTLVGAGEAPRSEGGKLQRVTDLRSA
jgi:hypothetical protein